MTEEIKTGCVCKNAGFCNRHGVNKTPHLHKLCQNHQGYFQMWEECRGPGQRGTECGKSKESELIELAQTTHATPQEEAVRAPTLMEKAKNFAKATKDHVMNGMQNVTQEKQSERLSICNLCPLLDKERMSCKKMWM